MGHQSEAQNKKPDFAFPKTVDKEAQADLKTALKADDAHAALNALIRISVANALIDPSTQQASIELVEKTAKKFEADPLAGMYYALLARLYQNAYESAQWRYDRRELPLTPLPKDITEWSGEQYRHKIGELCELACANPQALSAIKIDAYKDIIDINKDSEPYYPTLFDFVCEIAYSLTGLDKYPQLALSTAKESGCVPAEILWTLYVNDHNHEALLESYRKFAGYVESGLLLRHWLSNESNVLQEDDGDDLGKIRENITLIDEYLGRYPSSPFKNNLLNDKNAWINPKINISYPQCFTASTGLKIAIGNANARNFEIRVYKLNNNVRYIDRRKAIDRGKMVWSKEFSNASQVPFLANDSISVPISTPGYYAVIPFINGRTNSNFSCEIARCINAYPVALNWCENGYVIVTNPADGRPMQGVAIDFYDYDSKLFSSATDQYGIADAPDEKLLNNERAKIMLTFDGKRYDYDDVTFNLNYTDTKDTSYHANILTDRALYHPGETVNVMAVLDCENRDGKKSDRNLVDNKSLQFVFFDANYQEVDTAICETDEFGRATTSFEIPKDGLTGRFSIGVRFPIHSNMVDRKYFTVSDYKLPDFEVTINSLERNVPAEGCVTIKGNATSYAGMPMADATVDVSLSKTSFFRWLSPESKFYSTQTTTDADGNFTVVFDKEVFAGAEDHDFEEGYEFAITTFYTAQFRVSSSTGTTASASKSFSLGKQFVIDIVSGKEPVNGQKPFSPKVKVMDADGKDAKSFPMKWSFKLGKETALSGTLDGPIDISTLRPASYRFIVEPIDSTLANPAEQSNLVIYNTSTDIVPSTTPLWALQKKVEIDASRKAKLLIGTPEDEITLYCIVSNDSIKSVLCRKYGKGYHELPIDFPPGFKTGKVTLFTVKDCECDVTSLDVLAPKASGLQIKCESFRDKLIPTATETWNFTILDPNGKPIEAALALDMYNKALDVLAPQQFSVAFRSSNPSRGLNLNTLRGYLAQTSQWTNPNHLSEYAVVAPRFNFYGHNSFPSLSVMRSLRARKPMYFSVSEDGYEVCEESAAYADLDLGSNSLSLAYGSDDDTSADEAKREATTAEDFDFRDAEAPLAIWAPELTTDADGNVRYTFTVPNANTTWKLQAAAWSKDMEVGSLMREFIASKPIMVQPNTPRFMRAGDTAIFSISVQNNSDSACIANTLVELFDPVTNTVFDSQEFCNSLEAKKSAVINVPVQASASQSAIGFRVKSTTGKFSDGEQRAVPVLPAMAQLIETKPFYLNPGDTIYTTALPSEPGARISLTFCENPVWTIVSALPGLRENIADYANSAGAALFSAAIAQGIMKDNPIIEKAVKLWLETPGDSALVSMLEKNQDLKTAVLNATPWVLSSQSDTERMANLALIFDTAAINGSIDKAMEILLKLQRPDGGWAWSSWCNESSIWVTENVLCMMAELKEYGWLPQRSNLAPMINRAVRYLDAKIDAKHSDLIYTILRPYFKDIPNSDNGKKVVKKTLDEINKDWKKTADPAIKAMYAEALHLNGDKRTARKLMSSISEFGVWSKDQGLKFPSINSLASYAILLEAFGMIEPQSREVDGLRQQIIVRKQGTDWGSAVVTSEVVSSLLATGTKWITESSLESRAKVMVGDETIKPSGQAEIATGSIRANLTGHEGQQLTIETSGEGPAYGAVFAQFNKKMSAVEAASIEDLSIEKVMMRRNGTAWEYFDGPLKVGDRVKVQLTIHCKRNLNYVSIVDDRPACFEPVDQLPGWLYSEGCSFYRENRDSATTMHIVYMRSGTYLLTYEMNVTIAGDFSSGVATIQSQYAPELTAHSAGTILQVQR